MKIEFFIRLIILVLIMISKMKKNLIEPLDKITIVYIKEQFTYLKNEI